MVAREAVSGKVDTERAPRSRASGSGKAKAVAWCLAARYEQAVDRLTAPSGREGNVGRVRVRRCRAPTRQP